MRKILVYGDQEFFCHLLGLFLREQGYEVTCELTNIWNTIEVIRKNPPDVVFIDARRSKSNGVEDAAIIKGEFSEQKVIILSASSEVKDVIMALNLGIDGYLLKSSLSKEIILDLEAVCMGEFRVSHELIGIIIKAWRNKNQIPNLSEKPVELTPRESEIMVLISYGKTNKEISEYLLLSTNTIKNHVISIFNKLDVHTRAGAVSKWKNIMTGPKFNQDLTGIVKTKDH